MKLSSDALRYGGNFLAEHCAVSQHCPKHIDASACQGQDRLFVALALSAFPVVERLRHRTPPGGSLRGEVAGAQQSAVVAFRSMMIAADAARVPRCRCQAGDSGQPVRAVELSDPAPGRSSELGPPGGARIRASTAESWHQHAHGTGSTDFHNGSYPGGVIASRM